MPQCSTVIVLATIALGLSGLIMLLMGEALPQSLAVAGCALLAGVLSGAVLCWTLLHDLPAPARRRGC